MLAKNQVTDLLLECGYLQMKSYPNIFALVLFVSFRSRDNVVGIATGYRLDGRGVGVRVLVEARFCPLHVVQTGSGAHPASYPTGARGKAAVKLTI
jgi:hypothetical protein